MPEAQLFPPIEAFDRGALPLRPVRQGGEIIRHQLAYSQWGAPAGRPVVLFHGGPGSGSSALLPRLFDPQVFRVIQFDQRGCGASLPSGELRGNRTRLLIDDAECLRRHLGIASWLVVGGSWGATLAACYAARYRPVVTGVVLRAIFLTGDDDLAWFFGGAGALHPEAWADFAAHLPPAPAGVPVRQLARLFQSGDATVQQRLALAWWHWEQVLSAAAPAAAPGGEALARLVRRYRVQSHYLAHRCWLGEGAVLAACRALAGLSVTLVHGRDDVVCCPRNAWRVRQALPESAMIWVDEAGHDPFHPAMVAAMQQVLAAC